MTDYSSTIRKVADPMLVELDTFYQTHKRHPNTQERDTLLLKAGCEKVVGNVCFTGGDEILVTKSITDNFSKSYDVILELEETICVFGLNSKNKKTNMWCQNSGCISWNH